MGIYDNGYRMSGVLMLPQLIKGEATEGTFLIFQKRPTHLPCGFLMASGKFLELAKVDIFNVAEIFMF